MLVTCLFVFVRGSWRLGPLESGLAITAALLLAPYAASNSVLTPFGIGAIPLLQKNWKFGIALVGVVDLPYLFAAQPTLRQIWEANYWTGVLLLMFVILSIYLFQQKNLEPAKA